MSKLDHPLTIKTPKEVAIMAEGGKKLGRIKEALRKAIAPGVNAGEIEALAEELIILEGAKSSFKMVPGYRWNTCVNVNDGIVHGIPHKHIVFKKGDLVSVDVGVFFEGFHTDTSFSVGLSLSPQNQKFLDIGKVAFDKAVGKVVPGGYVYDVSKAIEETIVGAGYTPVKALIGHGVGRNLHEEPQVPCIASGRRENTAMLTPGLVIAIEVMYMMGKPDLVLENDGWTIATADGKISALLEDTVAVTENGHQILTG